MPSNSPKASPSSQPHSDDSDFFGVGGFDQLKQRFTDWYSQVEDQTRETPSRSLLYAAGAGYVLSRLPVFRLLFSLLRLAFMALKPAVLIYAAMLAYRRITESNEH
ncbi:MAG: hypothetical protein JO295_12835 [Verrucomicrobia bacterium]|nr:hypothetical protein [Verrucomicrobiota bacterium]